MDWKDVGKKQENYLKTLNLMSWLNQIFPFSFPVLFIRLHTTTILPLRQEMSRATITIILIDPTRKKKGYRVELNICIAPRVSCL